MYKGGRGDEGSGVPGQGSPGSAGQGGHGGLQRGRPAPQWPCWVTHWQTEARALQARAPPPVHLLQDGFAS